MSPAYAYIARNSDPCTVGHATLTWVLAQAPYISRTELRTVRYVRSLWVMDGVGRSGANPAPLRPGTIAP